MQIKNYIILLPLLALSATLCAQTVAEIQQSPDFLWGTGNAASLKQADNDALGALISQISTKVSANFEKQIVSQNKDDREVMTEEKFKSVINTYSRATLNNTRRIVIQNEPDAAVMRYIKISEIQRIFEGRKSKILNFVQEAQQVEKKAQVADALRYYYWAFVLLQSYPEGNYLTAKDEGGTEQLLSTWIPKQMNAIFSQINLSMERVQIEGDLKTVYVKVLYKGEPACNYDYTYFDGRDWSNIFSAKDGRGIIELPALAKADELSVKTEYMFEGEANIDNELAEVMTMVTPQAMRESYLKLEGKEASCVAESRDANSLKDTAADNKESKSYMTFLEAKESTPYLLTMQKVETAIRSGQLHEIESLCTATGYELFSRLIKYGHAKIIRQPNFRFMEYGNEVTCRSLPMSFSFAGNRRTFVEDVVFVLNKEAKIVNLSFALNKPAVDDIMNRVAWSDTVRKVLINFLESYKTAYALKRTDYISNIFSDDALIITGSIVKQSGMGEKQPLNENAVKYVRQSKQDYLKKLAYIFNSNEFVNLRFADNQVRKSGVGGEVYGIQIKQDYFSSSYGDTGYLFLMVDLNNPQEPLIHVRTWQPEKDPNFGLIDLSYF